ncbi:MAG: hypothetical protein RBQ91_02150 [Acholeplasma sp.]|nr:hypothetical protein [Acholeplasma sp.]
MMIELLIKLGFGLAAMLIIMMIWYIFWAMVFLPINKRNATIKELEEQTQELQKIQAQKGVEWDKYKEIVDEIEKVRKSYLTLKSQHDKLLESSAKLELDKEKLIAKNKELKSSK